MSNKITADKSLTEGTIFVDIKSNESDLTMNLVGGFAEFNLNESIFEDTMRVNYIFIDTSESGTKDKEGKKISFKEGLPLNSTEDINFKVKDDNGVVLKLSMQVDEPITISETSNTSTILLKCVSEEFMRNECDSLVTKHYEGNICDNVELILKENLQTEKKIFTQRSKETFDFVGNKHKPLYILNWLSKHDSPDATKPVGGYLLYETHDGFHYKSINFLFNQEEKRKLVYTENPSFNTASYDGKVLDVSFTESQTPAMSRLISGAYNTKTIIFNPATKEYSEIEIIHSPEDDATAAKRLPNFNKKFENRTSLTTFVVSDVGTKTEGSTENQIKNSEIQNFNTQDILNQSHARYNQIQSQIVTITIAGDFTLSAGDTVHVDTPSFQLSDRPNTFSGGKYLIVDLCHHISARGIFTKMNLARDTLGRKISSRKSLFANSNIEAEVKRQTGDNFTTP
tara:strand:+ start:4869 stop:6233 length:1365 start_codon:yes stop_codon:yes gene_type:complete